MEHLFQFLDGNSAGLALLLAIFVDENRIQNGKQPRLAISSLAETGKGPKGAQVSFLDQIARVFRASGQVQGLVVKDAHERHSYRLESGGSRLLPGNIPDGHKRSHGSSAFR